MARYIDADALKEEGYADEETGEGIVRVQDIDEAPTIEARPVVRGEWIAEMIPNIWDDDYVDICYKCSECGMRSHGESPFCPNCGADLRTKEEDNG